MRFLFIGAHPDDADLLSGGTAIKLARDGHEVHFVSGCNGDLGHYAMSRAELAARRYNETQAAAKVAGIAGYHVLSHSDCGIYATRENRDEMVRLIRSIDPDVVITHRTCDYHVDHRNVGQIVLDAAYLIGLPLLCPEVPICSRNPVFGYFYDKFMNTGAMRPDAAVSIDDVYERKLGMLDCQKSQFYEWLAWEKLRGNAREPEDLPDLANMPWEKRADWLDKGWGVRHINAANSARDTLAAVYGAERAAKVKYAETFEMSEYGRRVSPEEFRALFPR